MTVSLEASEILEIHEKLATSSIGFHSFINYEEYSFIQRINTAVFRWNLGQPKLKKLYLIASDFVSNDNVLAIQLNIHLMMIKLTYACCN